MVKKIWKVSQYITNKFIFHKENIFHRVCLFLILTYPNYVKSKRISTKYHFTFFKGWIKHIFCNIRNINMIRLRYWDIQDFSFFQNSFSRNSSFLQVLDHWRAQRIIFWANNGAATYRPKWQRARTSNV